MSYRINTFYLLGVGFLLMLSFSFAGCTKKVIDTEIISSGLKKKNNIAQVGVDGMVQVDGTGGQTYFSPTRWVIADNFRVSENGNTKIEVKIWADQIWGEHSNYLEVPVDDDFVVIGGGARITGGWLDSKTRDPNINALLTASFPVDDGLFNKYAAASKDHEVPYAHQLTVYAIGLKVYYYSAAVGDYVPFESSVIKSQMYITHVTAPFQNGEFLRAYAPPVTDPLLYFTLCAGGRLSWPQGQSGLLLTEVSLSAAQVFGGCRGKDHAVTTLGGTTEAFCLYFKNRNPLRPSEFLVNIRDWANSADDYYSPITQHLQTLEARIYNGPLTSNNGYLICSLNGLSTYSGYGRMIYALYPQDGLTGVLSTKDHLESDISGEMGLTLRGIKPAY